MERTKELIGKSSMVSLPLVKAPYGLSEHVKSPTIYLSKKLPKECYFKGLN